MKRRSAIVYYFTVPPTRQEDAIREFIGTFGKGYTININKASFPVNNLHCYLMYQSNDTVVISFFESKPIVTVDLELQTYHDIPTIPLMHNAIKANALLNYEDD